MPAMPSWTVAGRFGIARTTGTPSAIWRSIAAVGIAAATESTVCSGVRTPPISPSRASKSCGLTAITTSAASVTASAFESVTRMPWRSSSSRARSSSRTVATISPGSRQPPLSSPRRSDSPIVPAPRMATRRASTRPSLGSFRQAHEALGERVQQIDAREPGPLAVRLEQLGGLPALDPAAAERGEQLHEAEVGDEPAVVAAEALEEDDPDRPGPEPAFAEEPFGRCFARERAQPLEVERTADPYQRGPAAHPEAQAPQLCGGDSRKRLAARRRVQFRAGQRRRERADHGALDLARPARLDQLPADGAQQRVGDGRGPKRPQPALTPDRFADQRVTGEALDELGVVVVDREDEAELVDPGLTRRPQLDGAVRLLPGSAGPAARKPGDEHAVDHAAGRVAPVPQGGAEGVGAPRPNRGRDQRVPRWSAATGSAARSAARSSTSSASSSRPERRRNLPQAR